KGFNIKGRESMKAMGRRSLAESPLLHAISDTTQAMIRAHKNEVGNTFLKLVEDNPNPSLWEVFTENKPDKRRGEITKDGKKVIGMVNMSAGEMKASVDYFKTKIDGVERYIKIKDPLLLLAMGNLGVEQSNVLTQTLGRATRLLSALSTTWNPEFMLSNISRDLQTAIANILAETQVADGKAINTKHLATKMIKSLPHAMSILKQGFRNNNFKSDDKWGAYLKEFLESGAKTGWVNQKDIDGLAKDLKNTIARASNTKFGQARKYANNVADFVRDYNDIVENAARFSVYYHVREQCISVKQASSLSKNLTINFNRKGEWGNTLNSLFMFANASIQGTANMMRALATPKDRSKSMWDPEFYNLAQKLALGSIIGTVAMAQMMRAFGGEDEDGVAYYDKIPDHIKATNYVLLTGGVDAKGNANYLTIPMPYGYNFLANVGHAIDGAIQGKPASTLASNLTFAAVSTFSPFGAQESHEIINTVVKTATPTVGKPLVEMGLNENFYGRNIYPRKYSYSASRTDANLGTAYTWEWAKGLTEWLNTATGGTEFRSGGIDVAPQSIEHVLKFMGGGVTQFALRLQNAASKAMQGKDIGKHEIPFLRRFFRTLNPKQAITNFYHDKDELAKYKADYKSLHGVKRVAYVRVNKAQLQLDKFALLIDKRLRSLNRKKRAIENSQLSKVDKDRKLEIISDKKIELTLKFSKRKQELGIKYL
ncbi:MAG: hypothetical protein HRU25_17875, partial [Psychrobium sp.]|nr:hypothetical protein [Psychrobium sp.]